MNESALSGARTGNLDLWFSFDCGEPEDLAAAAKFRANGLLDKLTLCKSAPMMTLHFADHLACVTRP